MCFFLNSHCLQYASVSVTSVIFIIMCSGTFLFGFVFSGILWASWFLMTILLNSGIFLSIIYLTSGSSKLPSCSLRTATILLLCFLVLATPSSGLVTGSVITDYSWWDGGKYGCLYQIQDCQQSTRQASNCCAMALAQGF